MTYKPNTTKPTGWWFAARRTSSPAVQETVEARADKHEIEAKFVGNQCITATTT